MKIERKLFLNTTIFGSSIIICSTSCANNETQEVKDNLKNINTRGKNQTFFTLDIDNKKYRFKNVDDFVNSFDYNKKIEKFIAVGDDLINDEKNIF